jgi:glycosyltransferase involved in cell wall biosynthesis
MEVWMLDAINMTPYYNASLCRALLAEGCQVTMMTSPFVYDPWPIYQGVNVEVRFSRFLKKTNLLKLAANPRVRRLLRVIEHPIDLMQIFMRGIDPKPILHFQWFTVAALDTWVWRILKKAGYPLVHTAHNILPHGTHEAPPGLVSLYSIPQRIIVHTPKLAEELCTLFPGTASRVRVIPHGTLFDDVPTQSRSLARQALGIAQDSPVVLFWGLLTPHKGVEGLIRAFSKVVDKVDNALLLLVGKPNTPIAPYRTLIAQLNLETAIRTHFGFVPTGEISKYFGAADVVVLPYLKASQSGVLLAAYRFGRAVIVTDTGGLPDTVESGVNGLIVPPGDESALVEALIELLSKQARTRDMGGHSRRIGLERYNWRDIARQTITVYQELEVM